MQEPVIDLTTVGSGTVTSFLELRGLATVTAVKSDPAVICTEEPFHWNGTELVICAVGTSSWPELEAVPVDVSLVAGNIRFQFDGDGSTDQVDGVAPEYREQLVTYMGAERGHAIADEAGRSGRTRRLFITPSWDSESSELADR